MRCMRHLGHTFDLLKKLNLCVAERMLAGQLLVWCRSVLQRLHWLWHVLITLVDVGQGGIVALNNIAVVEADISVNNNYGYECPKYNIFIVIGGYLSQ